jgi:CheY-like chemotaxis protein
MLAVLRGRMMAGAFSQRQGGASRGSVGPPPYLTACFDLCVALSPAGQRIARGGSVLPGVAFSSGLAWPSELHRGSEMPKRCRILIVENEQLITSLLEEAISLKGYAVEIVSSAAEAFSHTDLAEFDIVITDLTLPGGSDGWTVADRASATGAGVILITGDPGQYDRLIGSGHAWLKKPFRNAELIATMEAVLRRVGSVCETSVAAAY